MSSFSNCNQSLNPVSSSLPCGGNLEIRVSKDMFSDGLNSIFSRLDESKGVIFSSGFDYPGRHSRWDVGFVDPALEFIGYSGRFQINGLNDQGKLILPVFLKLLSSCSDLTNLALQENSLEGEIVESKEFFTEENRSRKPSVFSVIRKLMEGLKCSEPAAQHFGFYGAFGYDLIFEFEDIELKQKRLKTTKLCHLYLPLEVLVIDRRKEISSKYKYNFITEDGNATDNLSSGGRTFKKSNPSGSNEIESDHSPEEFIKKVEKVIDGTKKGDYFEVILSQTFSKRFSGTPTELFQAISKINPSPYMFLINLGDEQLVGSSPEIYVRVTGQLFETCPISGTLPRGKTPLEDHEQVKSLLASKKEEAELTMCTDVDRNDMARVCRPGSVKIVGRRQLEFYSHVIHTVDHLKGELLDKYDALDAFQTHMWACTVTGAPKAAAVQEIEDTEKTPRGWYSGAVGMLSVNGDINTGITLRTAHLLDGKATVRAGATILFDSIGENEEKETRHKAAAFLSALTSLDKKKCVEEVKQSLFYSNGKETEVLLVDCRDSFAHNLASYLRELGVGVTTVRPDFPDDLLDKVNPSLVLLSPGPGVPNDFALSSLIQRLVERELPLFGVCLGHQALSEYFGGKLGQLDIPVHGKESLVRHTGSKLFSDVPSEFSVGRYHSLYVPKIDVPSCMSITAETIKGGIVMAAEHKSYPAASVQFHPESLMSLKEQIGHKILLNALNLLI